MTEAKGLFERNSRRKQVKRVVVVISDKQSGKTEQDIKTASEQLEAIGIQVIPVALGSESDPKELELVTSNKKNLVDSSKDDEDPKITSEKIMNKFFESEYLYY